MAKHKYYEIIGTPPASTGATAVYHAIVVAKRYRFRTPTIDQLQRDFGMSRATAHRWRAAFSAAGCDQPTGATP